MNNVTNTEIQVLKLMFKNMSNIIRACDGIDINYENFTHNDLYALFLKLDIGEFFD